MHLPWCIGGNCQELVWLQYNGLGFQTTRTVIFSCRDKSYFEHYACGSWCMEVQKLTWDKENQIMFNSVARRGYSSRICWHYQDLWLCPRCTRKWIIPCLYTFTYAVSLVGLTVSSYCLCRFPTWDGWKKRLLLLCLKPLLQPLYRTHCKTSYG